MMPRTSFLLRGAYLRWSWIGLASVGIGFMLMVVGCSGQKVSARASSQAKQYPIHEIVVLPFRTLGTPQVTSSTSTSLHVPEDVIGSDISLATPRPQQNVDRKTVSVPSDAGVKVANILANKLARHSGVLVHVPKEAEQQISKVRSSGSAGKERTEEQVGQAVAQGLHVDAALIGLLRIYKEREGGKYGAEPAVVGFEVKLIAADGKTLWDGNYYESQRPLTEDVGGFLSRGFGFFTAEELAAYGAEELAKQFPFGGTSKGDAQP